LKRISWITWRLFFITLPADVFALVFLSNVSSLSAENAPSRVAIALIAHASLAPFFMIAVRVSAHLVNWRVDLSLLVALGVLRGIAIVLGEDAFNLTTDVTDSFRVFNSAIAFPTWFIFFTIVIDARHQYQREFKSLFKQLSVVSKERKGAISASLNRTLGAEELMTRLQSLSSKLGNEIHQVLASSKARADYPFEASKIQELVNIELRPASKQMWQRGLINGPQIFKLDLIRIILFEQRLPINFVIIGSAPFLFVGIFGAHNLTVAILQTSVATVPVLISFFVIEKIHKKLIFARNATNSLILGLSYLAPIFVQYFLVPDKFKIITNGLNLFLFQLALWLVLIILLIGYNLSVSLRTQRQAVILSLKSLLNDKKYLEFMDSELTSLGDIEMSRYLHGEIQTGLTAAILLLQQASKNGDAALARQGLENAVKILMQNHLEAFAKNLMSNDLHLDQIVSGWRGIADVSIALHFVEDLDQAQARDVIELIGEGVANAIRHGKATKIFVTDERALGELRIRISSDGHEVQEGESGLGTEMFNLLTTEWSISLVDGQSELTFTVPLG
jgi:signal transduction histidine kinase